MGLSGHVVELRSIGCWKLTVNDCIVLQTPQTIIRAVSNSDQHTYKTITTIATAQKQLKQPGQVLLYVPFTKATIFTALVLPVSDAVQQHTALNFSSSSGNASTLSVKANTNSKALANTLTFDLIKKGPVTLTSAGAAAAAKAAAALALVREQMLTRGYELGVLPRFAEGPGRDTQVCVTALGSTTSAASDIVFAMGILQHVIHAGLW